MSSLDQLLAQHQSLLVLDGSGWAQAAWFAAPTAAVQSARGAGEVGRGMFEAVKQLDLDLLAVGAFAFCDAPGSILGIRTTAAAIVSWTALRARPVYGYHALRLAAAGSADPSPKAYIADARRGLWHFYPPGGEPQRLATAELEAARGSLPLVTLDGYRHWEPLPPQTAAAPYELGPLLARASGADLFHPTPSPDALLFAQPSYVQWTRRIHQTP